MALIWAWQEENAEDFWQEAKRVLKSNGIIALPTDTFYALAVNPFQEAALSRLFALKQRPPERPVLLLVDGQPMLKQLVREIPNSARLLMEQFWPGPLTLILPSLPHLPRLVTAGTGTIGVRYPRHLLTCRLITELGHPVTGTSANRSGRPPLNRAAEVAKEFNGQVDLILETGDCPGGLPSSIVDVSSSPPRLVRPGAVAIKRLTEIVPEVQRLSGKGEFR